MLSSQSVNDEEEDESDFYTLPASKPPAHSPKAAKKTTVRSWSSASRSGER